MTGLSKYRSRVIRVIVMTSYRSYINTPMTSLHLRACLSRVDNFRSATSGFRWREVESYRAQKCSRRSRSTDMDSCWSSDRRRRRCVDYGLLGCCTLIRISSQIYRTSIHHHASKSVCPSISGKNWRRNENS